MRLTQYQEESLRPLWDETWPVLEGLGQPEEASFVDDAPMAASPGCYFSSCYFSSLNLVPTAPMISPLAGPVRRSAPESIHERRSSHESRHP